MAVASRDEFVACVAKSNIIPQGKLKAWLASVDDKDSKTIASKLVREKFLTLWQAKFLLSGRSRLSVGNYLLQSRISSDELGDKFEAIHTQLNRQVVIQFFPSEIAQNESLLDRLLKKLRQITELDHPNVIHVYDVDHESERYFLVTEYLPGKTLDSIPPDGLNEAEVARIVDGIAAGLDHAHQSSIVHGNVTPENIIVTDQGESALQGFPSATLIGETLDTKKNVSDTDDFKRLVKVGITRLRKIPESDRSDQHGELSKLIFDLAKKESRSKSIEALHQWVGVHGGATSETVEVHPVISVDAGASALSNNSAGNGDHSAANLKTDGREMKTIAKTSVVSKGGVKRTPMPTRKQKSKRLVYYKTAIFLFAAGGLVALGYTLATVGNLNNDVAKDSVAGPPANQPASVTDKIEMVKAETAKTESAKSSIAPAEKIESPEKGSVSQGVLKTDRPRQSAGDAVDPESNRRKLAEFFANRDAGRDAGREQTTTSSTRTSSTTTSSKGTGAANRGGPQSETPGPKRPVAQPKKRTPPKQKSKSVPANKAGPVKKTKSKSASPAVGSIEAFPGLVDLPATSNTSDVKLGDLVLASNYLLGLELLAEPIVARGKVELSMRRSAEDKQLWNVELNPKRSDPVVVAQFQKTPAELTFRWLPAAAQHDQANYLRNGRLKLFTPKDFTWLGLRKPVIVKGFAFESGQTEAKLLVDIDWLPNSEAMKIQLEPFDTNLKGDFVGFSPREITSKDAGRIFFRKRDQERFFFVEVTADSRRKLTFEAKMNVFLPNGTAKRIRALRDLNEFSNAINAERRRADLRVQESKKAKKPKEMETKDWGKVKYQIAKTARELKKTWELSKQYSNVAKNLAGKEIPVLVYFDMDGQRTVIAKSK